MGAYLSKGIPGEDLSTMSKKSLAWYFVVCDSLMSEAF